MLTGIPMKGREPISACNVVQNGDAESAYSQPLALSFTGTQQLSSGSSASSVSSLSGSDIVSPIPPPLEAVFYLFIPFF